VVLTVALAAVLHSYWALVAGILVGRLVTLVQSYTMSPYRPLFGLRSWRRIIGFSLWSWGSGLIYMLRDRIESIVIGRAFGAATVGVFSLGVEIGSLPTTELVLPLCRALFSGFAEANRTGLSTANVYVRVVSAALLLTLPAAIGISLLADPLVRLALGSQWLGAVPLVWILALPGAVTIISSVSAAALNAQGLPHLNFYLGAISTALKVPLLVGLVFAFGLVGGAVAVALSLFVEQLVYLEATRRRLHVRVVGLAWGAWRPLLATATMAAVLTGCGLGWAHADGSTLAAARMAAVGTLIGVAVYTLTLLTAWIASGRPDGAEGDALRLAQHGLDRLRQLLRVARPAVGS
jgi:O-antigen/teichoic acid export membrane protein